MPSAQNKNILINFRFNYIETLKIQWVIFQIKNGS